MLGDEGATASAPTARSLIESVSGAQLLPLSVVFQAPPSAAPIYNVAGLVGSAAIAVARPAPFVGPSDTQVFPATASGDSEACRARRTSYSRSRDWRRRSGSILELSPCRSR